MLTTIGIGVLAGAAGLIILSKYAPEDVGERLEGIGEGGAHIIAAPLRGIGTGLGDFGEGFERFGGGIQSGLGSIGEAFGPLAESISQLFAYGERSFGETEGDLFSIGEVVNTSDGRVGTIRSIELKYGVTIYMVELETGNIQPFAPHHLSR